MKLHSPVRVAKYRARGWWSDDTVDALFRKWVDERPDAPACADQWGTRHTWAELDASVDSLAANGASLPQRPGPNQ